MDKKIIDSIHQYLFRHALCHKQIARAAGISPVTLSRALNYHCAVSLENTCRVIEAMQAETGVQWEWPKN